jgi:hypothetical protein
MGNSIAYLVLVTWPLVTVALFRRLPLAVALCWAVVAGYLLLPGRTGWNFPGIPVIDKSFMIGVSAAIMCLVAARQARLTEALNRGPAGPVRPAPLPARGRRARVASGPGPQTIPETMAPAAALPTRKALSQAPRGKWLIGALLVLALLVPFLTVLTNGQPVSFGPRTLPGLKFYDGISGAGNLLVALLPFLLGMTFLGTHERHVTLLRALAIAGALYGVLALVEVRLSPQINIWVYGFFPHSWLQHVRGGFRPVVFLQHGLWLGIFLAMATLAACALWRQAIADRLAPRKWLWTALWLGFVLVLSRNLGATFLTLLIAPVIVFAGLRKQVIVAAVLAGTVFCFPILRSAGLVPTDTILTGFSKIDADRADSLRVRFVNEDRMLARANQKPLTGWGGYGRNRVYDERGRSITISDGAWIIILGGSGWLGYLARFGLLTLPLILLALRRREEITPATAGLMLVGGVALMDLIPNATLTPVTWLVCGAIAGRYMRAVAPDPQRERRGVLPPGSTPALRGIGLPGAVASGGYAAAGAMNGTTMNGTHPAARGSPSAPAGHGPAAGTLAAAPLRHQRRPRG